MCSGHCTNSLSNEFQPMRSFSSNGVLRGNLGKGRRRRNLSLLLQFVWRHRNPHSVVIKLSALFVQSMDKEPWLETISWLDNAKNKESVWPFCSFAPWGPRSTKQRPGNNRTTTSDVMVIIIQIIIRYKTGITIHTVTWSTLFSCCSIILLLWKF